jgi:hypothetical protein
MLTAGFTQHLIDGSRAQVVERSMLETLLGELKLGTSDLADRNTALRLGRILAARLMLTGKIVHRGPESQIALRLIETETGRISAAASETFPAAADVGVWVDRLSPIVVEKIKSLYPLRGMILDVTGDDIILNIGSRVGVVRGGRFRPANVNSLLEVVTVDPDRSLARVVDGERDLFEGLKFEAVR